MINKTIDRFLEGAGHKMDCVVIPKFEITEKREVYRDCAMLAFRLPQPLTPRQLVHALEPVAGLVQMYHHMRSKDTDFGQSLCFFQEAGTGEMYQLDCTTNGIGKIETVDVKLYTSLERMVAELRFQLDRAAGARGQFEYRLSDHELLSHFL